MNWRQSRQEDVARGAIILLISLGIAALIVGARLGSQTTPSIISGSTMELSFAQT